MQSTLRFTSCNGLRSQTKSVGQITALRKNVKQPKLVAALGSNKTSYDRKYIHTASGEGPLCQAESVKAQLKQVSNVDAPEKIRQAWFHPEFPVEKMTELLVSIMATLNMEFILVPNYNESQNIIRKDVIFHLIKIGP